MSGGDKDAEMERMREEFERERKEWEAKNKANMQKSAAAAKKVDQEAIARAKVIDNDKLTNQIHNQTIKPKKETSISRQNVKLPS